MFKLQQNREDHRASFVLISSSTTSWTSTPLCHEFTSMCTAGWAAILCAEGGAVAVKQQEALPVTQPTPTPSVQIRLYLMHQRSP